jgi:hypothetical protein
VIRAGVNKILRNPLGFLKIVFFFINVPIPLISQAPIL